MGIEEMAPFFQEEMPNMNYDDDEILNLLQEAMLELKKVKLDVPPTPSKEEFPQITPGSIFERGTGLTASKRMKMHPRDRKSTIEVPFGKPPSPEFKQKQFESVSETQDEHSEIEVSEVGEFVNVTANTRHEPRPAPRSKPSRVSVGTESRAPPTSNPGDVPRPVPRPRRSVDNNPEARAPPTSDPRDSARPVHLSKSPRGSVDTEFRAPPPYKSRDRPPPYQDRAREYQRESSPPDNRLEHRKGISPPENRRDHRRGSSPGEERRTPPRDSSQTNPRRTSSHEVPVSYEDATENVDQRTASLESDRKRSSFGRKKKEKKQKSKFYVEESFSQPETTEQIPSRGYPSRDHLEDYPRKVTSHITSVAEPQRPRDQIIDFQHRQQKSSDSYGESYSVHARHTPHTTHVQYSAEPTDYPYSRSPERDNFHRTERTEHRYEQAWEHHSRQPPPYPGPKPPKLPPVVNGNVDSFGVSMRSTVESPRLNSPSYDEVHVKSPLYRERQRTLPKGIALGEGHEVSITEL